MFKQLTMISIILISMEIHCSHGDNINLIEIRRVWRYHRGNQNCCSLHEYIVAHGYIVLYMSTLLLMDTLFFTWVHCCSWIHCSLHEYIVAHGYIVLYMSTLLLMDTLLLFTWVHCCSWIHCCSLHEYIVAHGYIVLYMSTLLLMDTLFFTWVHCCSWDTLPCTDIHKITVFTWQMFLLKIFQTPLLWFGVINHSNQKMFFLHKQESH